MIGPSRPFIINERNPMKRFTHLIFYLLLFPRLVYAYLDPGSGSLILQLIIAFLAGLSLMIKVFWTKIKTFFNTLFSKDSTEDEQQEDE